MLTQLFCHYDQDSPFKQSMICKMNYLIFTGPRGKQGSDGQQGSIGVKGNNGIHCILDTEHKVYKLYVPLT
jgi:hypothetical protein